MGRMADLERLLILGVRPDAAGGLPPKGGEGDSPMRRRASLRDASANGRGIPWDKSHGYRHEPRSARSNCGVAG